MRHTESFVGVPATLNALHHKDFKSEHLEVYISIRSLVSLSPQKPNFCFCFPGLAAIAKKFSLSLEQVREGIAWLISNSYIYIMRRGQRATTYTVIVERERFLRTMQEEGIEGAIKENEAWIELQRERGWN